MSKLARLHAVAVATRRLRDAQDELQEAQEQFYGALLDAYDNAPASEKSTQEEIARSTALSDRKGHHRGRIAQLLVAARRWRIQQ